MPVTEIPSLILAVSPDGPATIPLALLIVFVSAKLMAELFERLHQPGIVGEILAGVLVGPAVLGWLAPNEFLNALSELGAMFLLFRVGLDIRASELMSVGGTATLVAFAGVVVPFLMGSGIMLAWKSSFYEAIFVGTAMVATSVGITAQVLSAKGLLRTISARMILAAAVIDDVLGLLVLAVVSSLSRGTFDPVKLGFTALAAVSFTLIVAKWGTRAMGKIAPRADSKLHLVEARFALAMSLLFGLSVLAVYTGVAAIVGAFLAGLAMAESSGPRERDLATGVSELLVPFFLVGIGLHMDFSAFASASTVILAIVILIAAVASKFVGCGLGAWKLGKADAVRVGVGMVPRGEVGMVVAQIGLGLGIITQGVYGIVVFMSVATTILAPPLLKMAYRNVGPEIMEEEMYRLG